jgi:hypothetical protein
MKNLSIPKKLIVAFSTILILFVVTIIFSVFIGTRTVTSSFKTFYNSPFTVNNAINNMRRQMQGIQKDMATSSLTMPPISKHGWTIGIAGTPILTTTLPKLNPC